MERAASVDPGIFKAYDVRGIYPDQIDADVAEQLGRAFIRVLAGLAGKPAGELRVGLGRDMRESAPELAARARDGAARPLLGPHILFGDGFPPRLANLARSLEEDRLALVDVVCRRADR